MEIDTAKIPYFGIFKKKDLERNKSKDIHIDDVLINLILENLFNIHNELIC